MCEFVRKIGGHEATFTYREHELLINIVNPNKTQMLFNRITDHSFPEHLKEIVDNIL
jgi:hypothetical protein